MILSSNKLYSVFLVVFLLFISFSSSAVTYTSNCRIHQVEGPVDANDINQKVLRIVLNVGPGGGTPTRTSMDFNLFGNLEVSTAKLFYGPTVNDSNFTTALQAASIPSPGGIISFTGFTVTNNLAGNWFYWLVIDANAVLTPDVKIDAEYTGSTGFGTPTFLNGPVPINPLGSRRTGRNYTIGTTETYPTLQIASNSIALYDYDGAQDIFMELTANYGIGAETSAITFREHTGPATIIFRPAAGQTGKVTQAAPGSSLAFIGFQGAQKITFDGRPGGTGTTKEWTIRNTRTAITVGSTLFFSDAGSFNTFKYLNIEGEVAPAQGGIIVINTSTALTGNTNLNFNNCFISDITSAGGTATLPYGGIVSTGTAGKPNSNITIDSCEFINIFNPSAGGSTCINANSNSDLFTITNNHFYQTANYANLNNTYRVINIISGGGHTVTGNFIGGTNISCGGTAYTITSGTADFNAIFFGTSVAGGACTVSNNTIANIAYTTTMTTAAYPFVSIALQGSTGFTCGSLNNGNTIGNMSATGSITVTNNAISGSSGFVGIYQNSSGISTIAYNNIGGITVQGTRILANCDLIALGSVLGTVTIQNNTLGGTVANSILVLSDSPLSGIWNGSNTNGITVTDNTLQNFKHSAATTNTSVNGIGNLSGPFTCTGNIFKLLNTSSDNSHYGIRHQGTTATISSNTIQDITLTSTGASSVLYGIYISTASAVTCNSNTIGSAVTGNISLAGNSQNYGIYKTGTGTLTCDTNTVRGFNLNNDGASVDFKAISSEGGVSGGTLSATGDTIRDISISTTKIGGPFTGIYISSNAVSNIITKCTIEDIRVAPVGASSSVLRGVFVSGAGGGTVSKNTMRNLSSTAFSGGRINGILIGNSGNWEISNNVILIDNAPNTGNIVIMGIDGQPGAGYTTTAYHNTIKVSGTVASGTGNTMCYYAEGSGSHIVKNNLFQNLRTGGTGKHYAEYNSAIPASYITDYNYLENDVSQSANICSWTSDYNFTGWKGTPVNAANSQNGTIALDAIGKVTTNPFIGAGTGTNLTVTVTDDKLDITRGKASWMGAYEGQNITVSAISPTAYCAGAAVSVPYTVGGSGGFNIGNIFTAQLSDAAGSFAAPTNIGTLAATAAGTISATIPGAQPAGTAYRIRVKSSDPIITGSDNGTNIDIQTAAPSAPVATAATGISCSGFTANWNKSDYNMPGGTISTCSGNFYDTGGNVSGYTNNQNITTTFCSLTGDNITVVFSSFSTEAGFDILEIFDGPNTGSPSLGTFSGATSPGTVISTGSCLTFRFISDLATTGTGWAASISCSERNTSYLDVATDAGFTAFVTGYNNLNVGKVTIKAVTGLLAGTNYYYRVRAGNGCGTSANSGTIGPVLTTGTQVTYTVTSTANGTTTDGVSLRWAITQANTNCGHDIIKFNLGIGGPFTIALTAALPSLTDNDGVTIDGWDNSGNNGTPNTVYATSGSALNAVYKIIIGHSGTVVKGLQISSNSNIIKGLVLPDFGDGTINDDDIAISIAGSDNQIIGCYIAMDAGGTVKSTKTQIGIQITSGNNNSVGDGTAAGVNLISGTNTSGPILGYGVFISTGASNTIIKGNIIGLQKDGATKSTGQYAGIVVATGSSIIGGTGAGDGNVVSANDNYGIQLTTSGNTVLGNIIGPQSNGTGFVTANSQDYGIYINAANNIIGGNTVAARNIISANELYGVYIIGASATGNVAKGNYIGIDKNGTTFITSSAQDYGIYIASTSGGSNTIGGSGAGEGNVISGAKAISFAYGIYSTSSSTLGDTIIGNIIGPQADGISYVASNGQTHGLYFSGSSNNIIGGNTTGARNIISANETAGVYFTGATTTGNVVKGNYIGIDKNGTSFITGSTQDNGVYIESSAASNTIGGSGAGEGNVISGNKLSATSGNGIYITSGATAGNTILGNIIGPQADGITYVTSNAQFYGIYLFASPNNTIGGNTAGARNIISANETYGVFITGAGSTGNVVKGNYIGIAQNGTTFITGSTQDYGVFITLSAASNTIGGSGAGEGNVISGNKSAASYGIYTNSTAAAGNTILGNIIGPQADGVTYLAANAQYRGIEIDGSPNNTIGGNTSGARNIISANEAYGIDITGAGATGNVVKGNYIGIDKNGTTFITGSTQDYGVYFFSTAGGGNTIGGSVAGEGNVISGNKLSATDGYGIVLGSSAAAGNTVIGNIIGPQADGVTYLASNAQFYGVYISSSPNNTIGGNTAGARNIISTNETYGIYITGAGSTGNLVKGNYLGPGSSLANITSSNQDYGVYIAISAASNKIGTGLANEENQIAFNTVNGAYLTSLAATGNLISRNPIYSNTGKPINLNYGASQANSGKAVPVITTINTTTVSGTSGASNIIEVFKNTTGNCNDATNFVGSATADGAGNWTLAVALAACDYVIATATDASNNTSEFSGCVWVPPVAITTAAIAPTALCAGVSLNVSYTVACPCNTGNVFTAQLSDAAGSFTAPTNIGTLASLNSGTISSEIPSSTPAGAGYRIRVISSNPAITGTDNGANLSITVCSRYWVGNAGNWNDVLHWSTTSGGASGASIPHKGVYVYFDNLSFSGPAQVVTMPAGVWYMKSFIPSGVGQQAAIVGQGQMVVGQ